MENDYLHQSISTAHLLKEKKLKVDSAKKRSDLITGALSLLGNNFTQSPFKRKKLVFAPIENKAREAMTVGLQADFHASCSDIAQAARKVYKHHG